jgi:DNA polymerase III delta prime subunit
MLQKFYTEKYIRNSGEYKVSQLFGDAFLYDDQDWYVFHSYPIAEHVNKRQGECDFLILSKKGILIIEVKGGVVNLKDGKFYFPATKHKSKKVFDESPFDQADGCRYSLINFFRKKKVRNCYIQSGVAFPNSPFKYEGVQYENFWHLDGKTSFYDYIQACYQNDRGRFKNLSTNELQKVLKLLNPEINSSRAEVRIKENLQRVKSGIELNTLILEGLYDNPRLLMQGPPGSGKSTYALEYAKKKIDEGKKGLYLTYNILLADSISKKHSELKNDLDVFALWPFYRKELKENKLDVEESNYKQEENLFIENVSPSKFYDFIVVDEAQDLFGDGLLKILNEYLEPDQFGVEEGEYLVLFDKAQELQETGAYCIEEIKKNSALFKLLKTFRTSGSQELEGFIEECFQGKPNFERNYQDIEILKFKKTVEIPHILIEHIHNNLSNKVYKMEDMVVLNSSNLLNIESPSLLNFYKENKELFNVLENQIPNANNRILVSTPLQFKGLEKPVVYLVVDDLFNKKNRIYFQFLIGITRAQSKLVLIIN